MEVPSRRPHPTYYQHRHDLTDYLRHSHSTVNDEMLTGALEPDIYHQHLGRTLDE